MIKNLWYLLGLLNFFGIQAQFVDFVDKTTKNRFLGLDMSICKITTNKSDKHYQKAYDCGNGSISQLLNVNFLSPSVFGQQFYMYNDFIYWIGKNLQSGNKKAIANSDPENNFSGSGVFMIVLGTSSYLNELVTPQAPLGGVAKNCPAGQNLVIAQLKYNDGSSIATWSQDAICCDPTDKFRLEVSSTEDNTVASDKLVDTTDVQGIDWMKDPGPSAAYKKADGSPRKIRLIKQVSSPSSGV